MTSYCRAFLNFSAHQKPTVGDTKTSYTNYDHIGWLKCDGRLLDVSEYRLLFDVVGYTFGGADTQFNLPDPAGRVIGIAGAGDGLTVRSKGSNVGEETHTLIIPEMPSHNHGVAEDDQIASNNLTAEDTHNHSGTTGNSLTSISLAAAGDHTHTYTRQNGSVGNVVIVSGATVANDDTTTDNTGGAGAHNHTITDPTHAHSIANYTHSHQINPAGGDDPHNNMQPTLFYGNMFIYCGKVNVGSFPYTTGTDLL